jgi:lipoprotein signal peptidase
MNKYTLFIAIVAFSVIADYVTKEWAVQNLASRSARWDKPIERVVLPSQGGLTLEEWAADEFGFERNDPAITTHVHSIDRVSPESQTLRLRWDDRVDEGDLLRVGHRQITVVPGFWNHVYVQNFGAAWGILSERNEKFRKPFFTAVTFLAFFVVLGIFVRLPRRDRLMTSALACILGGAVGNYIDRVRFGYVIDFIDWYVTVGGEEKHWPTFNVADIAISVAVGLILIQTFFFQEPEADGVKSATADNDDRDDADDDSEDDDASDVADASQAEG